MKQNQMVPFYAPDGKSLGFRTPEAAQRLLANGYVKASYGRKGHLKAIWLQREDGGNPIETNARAGTPYSYLEKLDSGHHCWKHRRLDRRDEDGTFVGTRGAFLQVVTDCTVP